MFSYCFGLQTLTLLPVVPLHSRSDRQSVWTLQVRAHSVPEPLLIDAQTDCSGHPWVEPGALQGAVQ